MTNKFAWNWAASEAKHAAAQGDPLDGHGAALVSAAAALTCPRHSWSTHGKRPGISLLEYAPHSRRPALPQS
eukprot:8380876-Pyramimonas_sp.AAC.1